jgi:short-subunit dehydrogenase
MELHLEKKNALILASSQGLGMAMAAELVKEGANVMLASRDGEKLAAVQRELSKLGTGKVSYKVTEQKLKILKAWLRKPLKNSAVSIFLLIMPEVLQEVLFQISMMKNGNNLLNLIY